MQKFVVGFLMLMLVSSAFAQESGVQEIKGSLNADTPLFMVSFSDIAAGKTIYVYLESEDFDPLLTIRDENDQVAQNDDISEDNVNSAIEFEIPTDGIYFIFIDDCCEENPEGDFRLLISLDTPEVLTGEAEPTGATIVTLVDNTPTESTTTTVYRHACLPKHDDAGRPEDVSVLLFDALGFPDDAASVTDLLSNFGFETVEELQAASDENEISWYFLLPFLQDIAQVQLHMCREDNGEFSFHVP